MNYKRRYKRIFTLYRGCVVSERYNAHCTRYSYWISRDERVTALLHNCEAIRDDLRLYYDIQVEVTIKRFRLFDLLSLRVSYRTDSLAMDPTFTVRKKGGRKGREHLEYLCTVRNKKI